MRLFLKRPFRRSFLFLFIFLGLPSATFAASPFLAQNEIRERVLETFKETPILADIARCESRFRQYSEDGSPLYGGLGNGMVGVMQIYADVHRDTAVRLGYDIETLRGNLSYAQYLYEHQGVVPWVDSSHCWRNDPISEREMTRAVADGILEIPKSIFSTPLLLGTQNVSVRHLQQVLNDHGFIVSESGVGSPGEETAYFGKKTRLAVQEFQCKKGIACVGDPGFGRVGPKTRTFLNALVMKDGEKNEGDPKEREETMETLKTLQKKVEALKEKLASR